MKITCLSDLHGWYPNLDGGEMLIIAGDLTARDEIDEYSDFMRWLQDQDFKHKIVIAGNHDIEIQNGLDLDFPKDGIHYLQDDGIEIDGLNIWGTPWTLSFEGINKQCNAFTGTEHELEQRFALIPNDCDILISHGPPVLHLDWNMDGHNCGSKSLMDVMRSIRPKLLVCGHIHENGCQSSRFMGDLWGKSYIINASFVDENYMPRMKENIITIEIKKD